MTSASSLLRCAREEGTPVIQGNRVTFLWEGEAAPRLISDSTGWDEHPKALKRLSIPFRRTLSQPVWATSLTVPRDAYVEYAFLDPDSQEHILDPYNARSTSNGMGNRNNFFYMPGASPAPITQRRADVPVGRLTHHRVNTWMMQDDGERDVHLYTPPARGPYPLLVVFDGPDYLHRGRLVTIVEPPWSSGPGSPASRPPSRSPTPGSPSTWSSVPPRSAGTWRCSTRPSRRSTAPLASSLRRWSPLPSTRASSCTRVPRSSSVHGSPGAFQVEILRCARYVDVDACVACDACSQFCPVTAPSEFDNGISTRKAIYMPFPQAMPNSYLVDPDICTYILTGGQKCGACLRKCTKEAIHFDAKDEILEIEVGNLIVATGYQVFDAG